MNIDREHEWQAQERALQQERSGLPDSADPRVARYRLIARALRQPLPDALPADFARRIAAQVETPALDTRLELRSQIALVALLLISGGVVALIYGESWGAAIASVLPSSATTSGWALALIACLGVSWGIEQLKRLRFTIPHQHA